VTSVISTDLLLTTASQSNHFTVREGMNNEQHSAIGRSLSLDQLSGISFLTSSGETESTFRPSLKTLLFREY